VFYVHITLSHPSALGRWTLFPAGRRRHCGARRTSSRPAPPASRRTCRALDPSAFTEVGNGQRAAAAGRARRALARRQIQIWHLKLSSGFLGKRYPMASPVGCYLPKFTRAAQISR